MGPLLKRCPPKCLISFVLESSHSGCTQNSQQTQYRCSVRYLPPQSRSFWSEAEEISGGCRWDRKPGAGTSWGRDPARPAWLRWIPHRCRSGISSSSPRSACREVSIKPNVWPHSSVTFVISIRVSRPRGQSKANHEYATAVRSAHSLTCNVQRTFQFLHTAASLN